MNLTKLKPGDILHCSGKKKLAKIIKAFTKSQFSHTALFIEIWGQPYIIDAQIDGVNLRPWNEWADKYKYDFVVHRSANEIDTKALSMRALTKVGHTGYDFESLLFKQPIELFTNTWQQKKNEQERMYCSEFVAWVYGVERSYRFSPEDMYNWCLINNFNIVKLD
jgi:uncharacterized protein YycO